VKYFTFVYIPTLCTKSCTCLCCDPVCKVATWKNTYLCMCAKKQTKSFSFLYSCEVVILPLSSANTTQMKSRNWGRVTRLDDFSPFGWLFTLCEVFSKITEVRLKSSMYICINFHKNGLGYILGNFSQPHLVTLMEVHPAVISLCRLKKCATYDRILRQDLTTGSGVSLLGVLWWMIRNSSGDNQQL
jgi:hypothetical protein